MFGFHALEILCILLLQLFYGLNVSKYMPGTQDEDDQDQEYVHPFFLNLVDQGGIDFILERRIFGLGVAA